MKESLLVIGNGFDLNCRLPSSYKNFFDNLIESEKSYEIFYELFNKNAKKGYDNNSNIIKTFTKEKDFFIKNHSEIMSKITFWHIYFLFKIDITGNPKWCDIENEILESLKPIGFHKSNLNQKPKPKFCFWETVESRIRNFNVNMIDENKLFAILVNNKNDLYLRIGTVIILKYIYEKKENSKISIKKSLENLVDSFKTTIFQQLNLIEEQFNNYLYKELISYNDYSRQAIILFNKIRDNRYVKNDKINIMNFNYTSLNIDRKIKSENVHGKLNSDTGIIFGIDNTLVFDNHISLYFSKTYRKIHKYSRYPNKKNEPILNDYINEIIFYGHSLNKQDYSYFQSIFDKLDIYKNEIHLVFLYSYHDGASDEQIEMDVTKDVMLLLNEYGRSMDNTLKGKNLIHKLLIEGRLFIDRIS